jgi:hypothetical protein
LLVVGDQVREARVDRVSLAGRALVLKRWGSKLSGRLATQNLELGLNPDQITGRIADRPVQLDVVRADESLTVSGRFGARAISLHLNVRAVTGEIGPCRYNFEFRRKEYAGRVDCGGEPTAVRLRIPAALVARGDVELAAMLTAFLAQ